MNRHISRAISLLALFLVLVYPNLVYTLANESGITYVLTSLLYALPLLAVVSLSHKRWIYSLVVTILGVISIVDLTMVDLFHSYILPGAIISTIMTNSHEASEFYHANLPEVLHWLPVIALCILSCITYRRPDYNKLTAIGVALSFLLPVGFVSYKMLGFYQSKLTTRYFVDNRILNRPPYNVAYQSVNAAKELHKRNLLAHAKETNFGAKQITPPIAKYMLWLSESLFAMAAYHSMGSIHVLQHLN